MKGWLIDSYRTGNKVVLWIKTKEKNFRIERNWKSAVYIEESGKRILRRKNQEFELVRKKTYLGEEKNVCKINIENISSYEKLISDLEKSSGHRMMLYNADIAPEQEFLYYHRISPGQLVEIDTDENDVCAKNKEIIPLEFAQDIPFRQCIIEISVDNSGAKRHLREISLNGKVFFAENGEKKLLEEFSKEFISLDPDIIKAEYAFSKIPFIDGKFAEYNLESPFHRWDRTPIKYKGNKAFYSYGRIILRDFAVRLKGRILIDTSTVIGSECDIEAIMELCMLTGARLQQVASRSFGAVFQQSLVRLMYEKEMLIPYKEKPVDVPITMLDMLAGDSGGHRFDPKVGYHENVAEIDFSSMFPWIIYNKNISADMMLTRKEPLEKVPRLSFYISHEHKGLVPLAIKPLLDKRMYYKNNPSEINKRRSKGIKQVLVTAYGYARFREFKLGLASSHMAICSYAREIILESARIAQEMGFTVVHGIVDSLFLKKKGITKEEVIRFTKVLEEKFGIPVSFEGLFKWIVFLPSINDYSRPLPSTYYGAFHDGEIKVRGIEMRQRSKPIIVRHFQREAIKEFAKCSSKKEIISHVPYFARKIRGISEGIDDYSAEWLAHSVMLSKTNYTQNNAQKQVIAQLQKKGIEPMPGQTICYIKTMKGAILPEDYLGDADLKHYRKMLEKSLFNLVQPFGFKLSDIQELAMPTRQTRLNEWMEAEITLKKEQKTGEYELKARAYA